MSFPSPTIEDRVNALSRRVTRAEEDVSAIITTVQDTRRRVARLELNMATLLAHFGLPQPTEEQIDAALGDEQ